MAAFRSVSRGCFSVGQSWLLFGRSVVAAFRSVSCGCFSVGQLWLLFGRSVVAAFRSVSCGCFSVGQLWMLFGWSVVSRGCFSVGQSWLLFGWSSRGCLSVQSMAAYQFLLVMAAYQSVSSGCLLVGPFVAAFRSIIVCFSFIPVCSLFIRSSLLFVRSVVAAFRSVRSMSALSFIRSVAASFQSAFRSFSQLFVGCFSFSSVVADFIRSVSFSLAAFQFGQSWLLISFQSVVAVTVAFVH